MTHYLSVFVTVVSRGEGDKIARAVVEERLAACANLFADVQSTYVWRGKLEQTPECALILKTTAAKFDALQTRIKELHSYECPCIVATPIVAGNLDYLDWLEENTR